MSASVASGSSRYTCHSVDGPGVNVSGSLNQVKTDLVEKLQQAVENVRATPAPAQAQAAQGQAAPNAKAAPAGTTPAPKKRNPLNDLLNGLGK